MKTREAESSRDCNCPNALDDAAAGAGLAPKGFAQGIEAFCIHWGILLTPKHCRQQWVQDVEIELAWTLSTLHGIVNPAR
jgi:hypothetical protein